MRFPKLFRKEIEDEFVQDNFTRIEDYFREEDFNKFGFEFFTFDVPAGVTDFALTHNLGYVPKDLIVTGMTGNPTLTWNYDLFDSVAVYVTSTAATKIRCLIGRYN